jgi:hypothetical protein
MNHKPEIHWIDPSGSLPTQPLVEAMYELLIQQCVEEDDPYKVYLARMKSQIYENSEDISHKLSDGYKSILENLTKK